MAPSTELIFKLKWNIILLFDPPSQGNENWFKKLGNMRIFGAKLQHVTEGRATTFGLHSLEVFEKYRPGFKNWECTVS